MATKKVAGKKAVKKVEKKKVTKMADRPLSEVFKKGKKKG